VNALSGIADPAAFIAQARADAKVREAAKALDDHIQAGSGCHDENDCIDICTEVYRTDGKERYTALRTALALAAEARKEDQYE
jgi:hypothetical protein